MSNPHFPLVSIITPSYNHARFIKETIDSVLIQDYPHIEHIIVDGGSTDGTLSILQQYRHLGDRLRFVSEPDHGQSHAINKGLAMARGEIIGWLNSDDTYQPGAVRKAVNALQQNPECAMVHGKCHSINEFGHVQSVLYSTPADFQKLYHGCVICQPAAFVRRHVFQQMGGVDQSLSFCMDYDLWIRISKNHTIAYVDDVLANARVHGSSKTSTQWNTVGIREVLMTVEKHYGSISNSWLRFAPNYKKKTAPAPVVHNSPPRHPASLAQANIPASFGHPDKVIGMNRYTDLWVPSLFRVTIQNDPGNPFHSLLVKGRGQPLQAGEQPAFPCNALVNGQPAGTFMVGAPSFTWDIPLQPHLPLHQVDILSSKFSMDAGGRVICYLVDEVLPLTAQEADFFKRSQDFFNRR